MKLARNFIRIRGEFWEIRRKSKMGRDWGWCQFPERIITIHTSLYGKRLLRILAHEIVHAFEFEYDFELDPRPKHPLIVKLELPIANFLIENGYVIPSKAPSARRASKSRPRRKGKSPAQSPEPLAASSSPLPK